MSNEQWQKSVTKPGPYLVWPVPAMVILGARFRNGRIMVGASQRVFADASGVSQTGV